MTELERYNRYHRRRTRWLQQRPPKWRVIARIIWRWSEPIY